MFRTKKNNISLISRSAAVIFFAVAFSGVRKLKVKTQSNAQNSAPKTRKRRKKRLARLDRPSWSAYNRTRKLHRVAVVILMIASFSATTASARQNPTFAKRTIIVSVDGLRPDIITTLGQGRLPAFYRLADEGAYTLNARTDPAYTITLPNHTSMLTARYVSGDSGHGWTLNEEPTANASLHQNHGPYIPSIFDVVHDEGGRTGLYASKTKFSLFDQSYNELNGRQDQTSPDFGADKIDQYEYQESISDLVERFVADASLNPFDFSFIHLASPDNVGHDAGWSADASSSYAAAVESVDAALVRLLQFVESDVEYAGLTNIILTADHGGSDTSHSESLVNLHYRIPFFAWGPDIASGIESGSDLYALNLASRIDPFDSHLAAAIDESTQPIRNADAANLALMLMGLPAISGSEVNASQSLRITPAPVAAGSAGETLALQDGVSPDATYDGTRDTKIRSDAPNDVFGLDENLEVDAGPNYASMLRWDLSPLPENTAVLSASITLYVTNVSTATYELYELAKHFDETSTTWFTQHNGTFWQTPGASDTQDRNPAVLASIDGPTLGSLKIDLSESGIAAIQNWVDNPDANFGFIIQNYDTADDGLDFASREASDPAVRPRLELEYTIGPVRGSDEGLSAEFAMTAERGVSTNEVWLDASDSILPGNTAVSYFWDFGDNSTAIGPEVSHQYLSPGTYRIQLIVADESGNRKSKSRIAIVEPDEYGQASFQDGVFPLESYDGTRDAKLHSDASDVNYGEDISLFIDGSPFYSTLLRWDLSAIAPGIEVTDATLTFNITDPSSDQYDILPLAQSWKEGEATWLTSALDTPWTVPGAAGEEDRLQEVLGSMTGGAVGPVSITLNEAGRNWVSNWINSPETNHGMVVQNFVDAEDGIDFNSSEIEDPLMRPRLDVSYQLQHHVNAPDQLPFQAYPNPFHSDVSILFDTSIRHAVELELYDMLGRRILSQTIEPFRFGSPVKLDTSFLAAGVYAVVMTEHDLWVSKTRIVTKGY